MTIKKALFYYYLENRVLAGEEREDWWQELALNGGIYMFLEKFWHLCFAFILFSKCSYLLKKWLYKQLGRESKIGDNSSAPTEEMYLLEDITFPFLPMLLWGGKKAKKNQAGNNFIFVRENIIFFSLCLNLTFKYEFKYYVYLAQNTMQCFFFFIQAS